MQSCNCNYKTNFDHSALSQSKNAKQTAAKLNVLYVLNHIGINCSLASSY